MPNDADLRSPKSGLVVLEGDPDGRLACPVCLDEGHSRLFEQGRDLNGEMATDPDQFELRRNKGAVQRRMRHSQPLAGWESFAVGTVRCVFCEREYEPLSGEPRD